MEDWGWRGQQQSKHTSLPETRSIKLKSGPSVGACWEVCCSRSTGPLPTSSRASLPQTWNRVPHLPLEISGFRNRKMLASLPRLLLPLPKSELYPFLISRPRVVPPGLPEHKPEHSHPLRPPPNPSPPPPAPCPSSGTENGDSERT